MNLSLRSRTLRLVLATIIIMVIVLAATLFWLSRNLTTLLEHSLRQNYGPDFSLGKVEYSWNRLVFLDVSLRRPGEGPVTHRISIGRVVMTPRFRTLLSRRIEIDLLRLENPRVLLEIAPDGALISPLATRPAPPPATGSPHSPLPLSIGRVEINKGELIFLDRSTDRLRMPGVSNPVQGYHLLRLTDIWFHCGPLKLPLNSAPLPVTLFLAAPGPGTLRVSGTFDPVTLNAALDISLRHWDLTTLRPYYLKPDNLDVTHGFLDGDATVTIAAKMLHVPGEIRIKELTLERTGRQGTLMGLSVKALLSAMNNEKGEIGTTFLLDGDLTDPQFRVRQSLLEQIGTGLSHKLGVPVISDVGSGIINLTKKGISGIRSLFGRKK